MMCIYYQIIDKVFIASREWKQELWTHRKTLFSGTSNNNKTDTSILNYLHLCSQSSFYDSKYFINFQWKACG